MGRDRPTPSTRARHVLFDNGVAALVFGVVCLLLPFFLGGLPASRALGQALRIPAYVGLALGALLLGLHALARRNPRAIRREWSAAVFDDMGPRGFDAFCEQLFAQAGFATRAQPRVNDGALDIWLSSKHAQGPVAIVRCRHSATPVDVNAVRDFHAVMSAQGVKRGTYATSSTFREEAARFAKERGINPLGRDRLLRVIATRTPEQQQELLATACDENAATAPCIRTSP
jgi:restriction system protein